MGLLGRIGQVIRSNINSMVSKAEDPEKILEQTVSDMQEDLIQMRQGVAQAIATQKRTERQYKQSNSTAQEWYKRAELAMSKGDESLAREALNRRKSYQDTADTLKSQLDQQQSVVVKLKENMVALERKIAEAKTKKDMYIARARSAQASQKLNEMMGRFGDSGAMAAFERMEEKVMEMEAQSEAAAELNAASDPIEKQFAALEGDNIDDELAAMRAKLSDSPSAGSLPASKSSESSDPEVDAELEKIRSELGQ